MFTWLKNFFSKKAPDDVYLPKERLIYSYFDGEKVVKADPLVLERRLMDVQGDLSGDLKLARSAHSDAVKGHENALAEIRKIFDVRPLEEGGLTEIETMLLLEHYLAYTDDVKKNSSLLATSPAETSAPSVPSSAGSQPTPSSSASGSTASGPTTGTPGPSPSGPG